MVDVIISKKNESHINIDAEMGIMYELAAHFEFFVDGYKFMPKFKAGLWDGKICLLDLRFGTLPIGLFSELHELIGKLGYSCELKATQYGLPNDMDDATYQDVETFITELNLSNKTNKLEVRKYQIEAVYNCIKNNRQLSISPTGSGKSLIIYCLLRWYLNRSSKHILIIVPNLSLIKQLYSDFKEYSTLNGFDVDAHFQIIAEGATKQLTKPAALACWQSIYKLPSSWYHNVDVIIGDEAHSYKAEACRNIYERSTETKYKFGVTGSLDKSTVNKLVLKGLIGEISRVKSTRDLIEDGHLSDIKIKCILLKYNDETKKLATSKKFDYQKEKEFLFAHEKRNIFIANLAASMPINTNTLVLFNHISHGELLYDLIKSKVQDQHVHFISGKVEADDRERIRNLVQESDGTNIILGSLGTTSTGINIPRLHNIIFASPSKSVIRVMQSIGRGLRKTLDKKHLSLYDIADDLKRSSSRPNFTMKHFIERLRLYVDEEHPYTITEFTLEK